MATEDPKRSKKTTTKPSEPKFRPQEFDPSTNLPSAPQDQYRGSADQPSAPDQRRASRAATQRATQNITPTDQMRDLIDKLHTNMPTDQGLDQEPEDLPTVRVDTQNLPKVASSVLEKAGVVNPEWHQVANLPGNMSRAILQLGRALFAQFTSTPTREIYMIGNVMGQGPNTSREVNAVAKWILDNGQSLDPGVIDFGHIMPGYEADIKIADAGGIRWMLVRDDFGQYIYTWPEEQSVDLSNQRRLR